MPTITFREYDPVSKAFLGNVSAISFGNMAAGTHSRIKLLDIAFTDVVSVDNVRLGVVDDGGIANGEAPVNIYSDGSCQNGRLGICHSPTLVDFPNGLTRHFAGTNGNGAANNEYNVSVGVRNDTTSEYVYLDIQPGSSNTGTGAIIYKVFFDFA
jgi:hypothetical protein